MVLPRPICKVVLSGTSLSGREIWSTSLSLDVDNGGQAAGNIRDTLLPGLRTAAAAWFSSPDTFIHSSAQLRTIKANMLDVNGRYASDDETLFLDIPQGEVTGGGTSNLLPPQCTVAVSLLTRKQRGLASRGRMFPPALAVALVNDTGGISDSVAGLMARNAATFLGAINRLPGYTVCVASEMRTGAVEAVERVEVGTVIDTQRRRRSALPEVYTAAPVSGG